jgi:hypothetical protein
VNLDIKVENAQRPANWIAKPLQGELAWGKSQN